MQHAADALSDTLDALNRLRLLYIRLVLQPL